MSGSQFQEFLENSSLFIIASEDPISDAISQLSSSDARSRRYGSSDLDELPQRKTLFFDEIIDVLVVLQTPGDYDEDLETLSQELVVSFECLAVGARRSGIPTEQDHEAITIKDVVCSWTNARKGELSSDTSSPPSCVHDESRKAKYIVWKAELHLNRARIRSSNPSLYFSGSATIPYNDPANDREDEDNYMPSGVPESMNLFDSFQNDPSFKGNPPILPASRLSKILPTGVEGRDQPMSIRNSSRNPILLIPAFRSRIRCSRIGASPNHAKVLACLDVDVAPFLDGQVKLEEPELTLSNGVAEPLSNPKNRSFPLFCEPHDNISFIYNLTPFRRYAAFADDNSLYTLTILLNLTLVNSSKIPIRMLSNYRLSVDLSILHSKPYFLQTPQTQTQTQAPSTSQNTSTHALSHLVTVTISSPPTTTVGATLTWSLLLANNSTTRTLDLAIIPITHEHAAPFPSTWDPVLPPAEGKADSKPRHAHKQTLSTSLFTATGRPATPPSPPPKITPGRMPSTAPDRAAPAPARPPAPPSNPVLLNPPIALATEYTDPSLISLTPDIRTGPLRPGTSMSTTMQFVAVRAGVVRLQTVRIVDLGGGDTHGDGGVVHGGAGSEGSRPFVDLKGPLLPDVIAFDAEGEDEDEDEELEVESE